MGRPVYAHLCKIVDEWIEIYKTDNIKLPPKTNKKYSGKFILRTGAELHKVLAIRALAEGESLNKFVIKKLKSNL